MKHILIFGASIVHGVGSEQGGGWAERLKASLHADMFGTPEAPGEVCQIYELGIPGSMLADTQQRFESELLARVPKKNPETTYIVFSAGINDAKAVDAIDNHLLSADDFAAGLHSFVHLVKEYSNHILGVGITPVNEARTFPKSNPLTGGASYFSNDRLRQFEAVLQEVCGKEQVEFVPLFAAVPEDWVQNYQWQDGIHPNSKGHSWIASQIEPHLRSLVGPLG